MHADVFEHQIH